MGLNFAKSDGLLPMRSTMAASKRPPTEVRANVHEELAVAASQWSLSDFPVIPPSPEFDNEVPMERTTSVRLGSGGHPPASTKNVLGASAGIETVPRPPKGRARFGQNVYRVCAGECVSGPGPGGEAATPSSSDGSTFILWQPQGRARYGHGSALAVVDYLPWPGRTAVPPRKTTVKLSNYLLS